MHGKPGPTLRPAPDPPTMTPRLAPERQARMPRRRPLLPVVCCLWSAMAALPAMPQAPQGCPPPQQLDQLAAAPGEGSPAFTRFQLGQQARQRGELAAAREHLRSALQFHPASPAILQELVLACADAPDERVFHLERLLRALADKDGRTRPDQGLRRAVPKEDLAALEKLPAARAAATAELVRLAGRLQDGRDSLGNGAIARLCSDLALLVMADAPALLRQHGAALQQALDRQQPDFERVLQALLRLAQRPPNVTATPGEEPDLQAQLAWQRQQEQSIRAARILAGLAQQARQRDLQGGAAPELGDLPALARDAMERLQDEANARLGRVWTIAELEALSPAERVDFTLAHRGWSTPGIALSPNGLYRVETVCGYDTLLGAARTVELHHRRLVDHFGKDPFEGRPGTVRIVPEHSGLESEGAPFWWAGGFQSGDRTVIRFAWSNVPGMGRVLTHELTHRFDGAVFPFQPSWLVEGHAVWTAAAYGQMAATSFADRHLDIGSCVGAFGKGYGSVGRLRQLLEGSIEDYRDNYAAGCALYTFLLTFPIEGEPKYRQKLDEFRRNGRAAGSKPLEFFQKVFCDGRDGRPGDLDGLAAEFGRFLDGIYAWTDRRRTDENRWIASYQLDLGGDQGELVPDEPTWSWARNRAEPFFGQDHATAAGLLLAEVGEHEAAAAALLWSLQVDGWRLEAAAPAPALLQQSGQPAAAAALTSLARVRFGEAVAERGAVPFAPALRALPALRDQLEQSAAALAKLGHRGTAAALRAERAQIGALLGLPSEPPTAAATGLLAGPRLLGAHGWTEDSLTGFDDRRRRGLWFVTPELDLHVGRERPRDGTGLKDRQSHQRDAFVRTVDWQAPGAYAIAARIHFTTSFASAAIVFGHTRRDRDLRLLLRAGDFQYAIGKRETERGARKVRLDLQGLWERDGHMPDSNPGHEHEMANDAAGLLVELQVRGPSVLVLVDGEAVMRYASHDGAPIEGSIGFATSMGAIRVQEPTVRRLDAGAVAGATGGLDLGRATAGAPDDLLLLPAHGVPLADCGTMLLWIPATEDLPATVQRLRKLMPYLVSMMTDAVEHPAPWHLVVPAGLADADVQTLQDQIAAFAGRPLPLLRHQGAAAFDGDPWALFVDQPGLLRAAAQLGEVHLFTRVGRWGRLFRRR